jgi:AcrR family transcriptional regulator
MNREKINSKEMIIKNESRLFLKDPEVSELGRKIIEQGTRLIDETGFDEFTFKKLACEINSTEASIYRYFENKHQLLFYLLTWYWNWLKYNIDFQTINLKNPKDKLKEIIKIICHSPKEVTKAKFIDETVICRIAMIESGKIYFSRFLKDERQSEVFDIYKEVCLKIATVLQGINPKYPHSTSLAVTLLAASQKQGIHSFYLKELTDLSGQSQVEAFLENTILAVLKNSKPD